MPKHHIVGKPGISGRPQIAAINYGDVACRPCTGKTDGHVYVKDTGTSRTVSYWRAGSHEWVDLVGPMDNDGKITSMALAGAISVGAITCTSLDLTEGNITNAGIVTLDALTADDSTAITINHNIIPGTPTTTSIGTSGAVWGAIWCSGIIAAGSLNVGQFIQQNGQDVINTSRAFIGTGGVNTSGSITGASVSTGSGAIDCGSLDVGDGAITNVGTLGAASDEITLASDVTMDYNANDAHLKIRFLEQSTRPSSSLIDTGELLLWEDTSDTTFHLIFNDGVNVFDWAHDSSSAL